MKKKTDKGRLRVCFASVMIVILCVLSACGGGGSSLYSNGTSEATMEEAAYGGAEMKMADYGNYDYYEAEESADYDDSYSGSTELEEDAASSGDALSGRKLIRDVDMEVETQNFDELIFELESKVKALGGYIEDSNTYNGSSYNNSKRPLRHSHYTARIPADKLDQFVGVVEGAGNVTSKNESVQDVTLTYVDLESHRNALREEEKQLLVLMERAETIEDLITIRNSLTDIRYQLESMESQLRTFDNRVSYSTVNISISEVETLTPTEPKSVGDRITEGFMENLSDTLYDIQEFFIDLITHLPAILWFLIRLAVFILIVLLIIRLIRGNPEKRAKRKAEKERKKAEKQLERQRKTEEMMRKNGMMPPAQMPNNAPGNPNPNQPVQPPVGNQPPASVPDFKGPQPDQKPGGENKQQ